MIQAGRITKLSLGSYQRLGSFTGNRYFLLTRNSFSSLDDSPTTKTDPTPSSKKTPVNRGKTPIGKLDELEEGRHPHQEKEPLPPWPDNTNPHTGEIGGPRGPEPTRYGDWERKGRVSDF